METSSQLDASHIFAAIQVIGTLAILSLGIWASKSHRHPKMTHRRLHKN